MQILDKLYTHIYNIDQILKTLIFLFSFLIIVNRIELSGLVTFSALVGEVILEILNVYSPPKIQPTSNLLNLGIKRLGQKMELLNGKVAVITGASRGLGKSIALIFAQAGASVILSSRSIVNLEQIAKDLHSQGYEASAFYCDVSNPGQVDGLARFAVQKYGGFNIWINNAGIAGPYGHTLDLSLDQFLSVLRTNIEGVYYGSRVALSHFLPRKSGKLVNILGAGSKKPAPNQNAYGSSKAWIRVFTLALAEEYRRSGVGVFTLQPGLMETELLTEVVTFENNEKRLRSFMPFLIRAAGKNPDVAARKLLWLVSTATDGKTGLDVSVSPRYSFLLGFLREGIRSLLRFSARPVEMNIKTIPSAFEPLDKSK
ncbi:MAG: SDR family NAD(P)-dependent oxidoreductase [Flavisolibacter sp.]